jgi:hypothetical protein
LFDNDSNRLSDTDFSVGSNYKDFVKLYFNDITGIPLLTPEEEKEVVKKVKE